MFCVDPVVSSNYYLRLLIKSLEKVIYFRLVRCKISLHNIDENNRCAFDAHQIHSISPHNLVYAFLICFCGVSMACGNSVSWLRLVYDSIFFPILVQNSPQIFAHAHTHHHHRHHLLHHKNNYYAICHSANWYAPCFRLNLLCLV